MLWNMSALFLAWTPKFMEQVWTVFGVSQKFMEQAWTIFGVNQKFMEHMMSAHFLVWAKIY